MDSLQNIKNLEACLFIEIDEPHEGGFVNSGSHTYLIHRVHVFEMIAEEAIEFLMLLFDTDTTFLMLQCSPSHLPLNALFSDELEFLAFLPNQGEFLFNPLNYSQNLRHSDPFYNINFAHHLQVRVNNTLQALFA